MNKLTLFSIHGFIPRFRYKTSKISKWEEIPWARVQERTLKLQRVIYKASLVNDIKKVRRFQKLLANSMDAKLLAIRRVTQDNSGKRTAGIDGVKSLTPKQRFYIASVLHVPTKSKTLRRVWIPKPGTNDRRPLGIPTIYDRCLQALFKSFLEPEWEAKFEPNSYGFRPGRSCRDALSAIKGFIQKKSKFVIDADIAKCFDRINHEALLEKIGMKGTFRRQLLYWLKSGVLDGDTFSDTEMGTPQGGVISPLLANIALHGLEFHLKNFVTQFPMYYRSGVRIKPSRLAETLGMVRYADDFVIFHHDKDILLACLAEVKVWLSGMGLEISQSKTRLTHTLYPHFDEDIVYGFDGVVGFNFLGYTIKQFSTKHGSFKDTSGKILGHKSLLYPSKKSINKYQEKLHQIILVKGKGLSQKALIAILNPVIRGWANYFGAFDSNTMGFLSKQDYLMYLKLRQWSKRIKGTSGKGKTYFITVGRNKWKFAVKNGPTLLSHVDFSTPNREIIKIRGCSSPYDNNLKYWLRKLVSNSSNNRVKFLLTKQRGNCSLCNRVFHVGDILEVDHVIPLASGGSNDFSNLQLLHRHCHHKKSTLDRYKRIALSRGSSISSTNLLSDKIPDASGNESNGGWIRTSSGRRRLEPGD